MSAATQIIDSWTSAGWRALAAAQQPQYQDAAELAEVERALQHSEPVVTIPDCAALRALAAEVCEGRGFILQGGDCAESLGLDPKATVAALTGLFDRLTARLPGDIIRIGRIAGQFAKPRSSESEVRGTARLPAYRGDGINDAAFTAEARRADPKRMIAAHAQAVETAAFLRQSTPPIFASHEALLLPYEQPQVRRDASGRCWSTSAHMLWVGDRTRQLAGAHVHFLSGIDNLVGVKCGPSLGPDQLLRLLDRLDPANRTGKLALIVRLGAERIADQLPQLISAVRREGRKLLWMTDPMHGNSRIEHDLKVRRFDSILSETRSFFAICRAGGVRPAGLHLEMSPDDVTECIGASGPDDTAGMGLNFQSLCDPRLNAAQAGQLVDMVAALK